MSLVYIYAADLWCEDDGAALRKELDEEGKGPEDPENELTYDSDHYPKGPMEEGESDTPNHCAAAAECLNAMTLPSGHKVGLLLTDDLTSDGLRYVAEAVWEGGEVALEVWLDAYADQGTSEVLEEMVYDVLEKGESVPEHVEEMFGDEISEWKEEH